MAKVHVVVRMFQGAMEEIVAFRSKKAALNTFQRVLWGLDSNMDEDTMTTATEEAHYSDNGYEVWMETTTLKEN